MTPPEKVVAAMPGNLHELSERTEYPRAQVLRLITLARMEGLRVNAVMQPRTLEASTEAGSAPTIYMLDAVAGSEVD